MEDHFIIQTENFHLTQIEFFIRMLVALGIGFVIGLEREYSSLSDKSEIFAGVRTFVFIVLLGLLSAFLSFFFSNWVLIFGLLGTIIIVIISYWISANQGSIGGTTEFSILIAYLLGCTTLLGFIEVSLAITVVVVVLLSLKVKLQSIIGRITQEEMAAFLIFVVLSLLILPFLPNQTFGPYNVFNPKELGWVIILTSGLGFVGHLLIKFLGKNKGIILTGLLGGFVSSTAVTWVFSNKSKQLPALSAHCAVAIMIASVLMILRVVVWVMIFKQELITELFLPITLIFIAGVGAAFFLYKKQNTDSDASTDLALGDPLNLKAALLLGLIYTFILFFVSYANSQFGTKGIYISSAIAGLTDIDAITISVTKLAGESIGFISAQNAILLATLSNTLVKLGIAIWTGSAALKKYVIWGYSFILAAGLIGFLIINV